MKTSERMIAVLCDPAGVVCIQGSDEDRKILQQTIADVEEMEAVAAKLIDGDNAYVTHAKREFIAAEWMERGGKFDCEMQELLCTQVMELLTLFGTHGHSGSSAPYASDLFNKLSRFKPLVPLTGEDVEWNGIGDGKFQNNRASHVFKDEDGKAYDIQGRVFKDPNGSCFTRGDNNGTQLGSRVYIAFPYEPKTEFVKVDHDGNLVQ